MSRFLPVCLCAIVAFVAVTGTLLSPVSVLAASGTLTMETPLHETPDHGAVVIALLSEGTVVSIDGPPTEGFYPVTAGNLTGWMRGETLELAKDVINEPAEVAASPEPVYELVPLEQETSEEPILAEDPPQTSGDATGEAALVEVAPVDPSAIEVVAEDPAPAPVAPDAATTEELAAPLDSNAAPDAGPVGPAAAMAKVSIRIGPGPAYDVLGTAPKGSTVEQTGHVIDGYVSVQYDQVSGWAALNELATAGTIAAEPEPEVTPAGETAVAALTTATPTPPQPAPDAIANPVAAPMASPAATVEPVATAAPAPWGPASVLVDMPIRTGPSANNDLIFTVPRGSTVEQTGQITDGFVSVQYKEVIGWSALEHLGPPIAFVDEAPAEESIDTRTPRPGSGVAYATADLSLRAGPSANEDPIVMVPAGSRLVLTGVMEGDFQRVTYGDEIGWIANDFLETPENPAPNGEARGKQQNYAEKQIVKIINQAADRYGQSRNDMLRVARCESNLDPYAVNPSGSYGLFQFIRSTWKSTPYGDQDIFDPQANANAAAWMWSEGRKSEWVCQ